MTSLLCPNSYALRPRSFALTATSGGSVTLELGLDVNTRFCVNEETVASLCSGATAFSWSAVKHWCGYFQWSTLLLDHIKADTITWKVPVDHVVQLGQVSMWEGWFLLLQPMLPISLARLICWTHWRILIRWVGRRCLEWDGVISNFSLDIYFHSLFLMI